MHKHTKLIIALILDGVFLLGLIISCVSYSVLANSMPSQYAGERFGGGSRAVATPTPDAAAAPITAAKPAVKLAFSQVTAYFPSSGGLSYTDILNFRVTLEDKLTSESLKPANADASLYDDAWSASTQVSVKGVHGTINTAATAVGGDFFLFHPMQLRSGVYISEDDYMRDRVVLDENAAWQLFGSYDVAGMSVTVNGSTNMLVAGVVENDDPDADAPIIFLPFELLYDKNASQLFQTYEIVMPNKISGYAESILGSIAALKPARLIESTGRFSVADSWYTLRHFNERVKQTSPIALPYWENNARVLENKLALLLLLAIVCAVCPLLSLILGFAWLLKRSKGKWRVVTEFFDNIADKGRVRRARRLAVDSEQLTVDS